MATHASTESTAGAESLLESTLKELGVEPYIERVSPLLTEYGVRVAGALVFLLASLWLSSLAAKASKGALERAKVETTLARYLSNMARVLVIVLAVVTCMAIVGIPVTSLAALIGAGGLAAGLALQGSLSNIAAGAALSITRPFRVGDRVVVAGQTGIVKEISLFTTMLDTPDNRRIIIPNGQIFGTVIENMTYNPLRRVEVDVGVSYGADMNATRRALEKAAGRVSVREPSEPPKIMVTAFADSSVNWRVCVWVPTEKFLDGREEAFHAIRASLDEAGIEIPFPQRVVHLRGDGSQRTVHGSQSDMGG